MMTAEAWVGMAALVATVTLIPAVTWAFKVHGQLAKIAAEMVGLNQHMSQWYEDRKTIWERIDIHEARLDDHGNRIGAHDVRLDGLQRHGCDQRHSHGGDA
jgi:hypothetical protein